MEIKYYGTSAGAGIPEIYCSCRVCEHARRERGKNIRTRSQAVIDGRLCIDYPVDVLMHTIHGGLDMRNITNILITHNHHDHYMPADIISRFQGMKEPVNVYISEQSGRGLRRQIEDTEEAYRTGARIRTSDFEVKVHTLEMFKEQEILDYTVIPLRARHAENVGAMNFIIRRGEKNVLWAHDTGKFHSDVKDYLKESGIKLDFVSLDCTLKRGEQITGAHMDLDWCIETRDMLREQGNLKDGAIVALSHIGHLVERTHDELQREAAEYGMLVAYDGMTVEF